jgi:hypothetical protein
MAVVFLLFLTLLLAGTPARAAEPEAAFLARLEQLRLVAKQAGPQLWPGWEPLATPLAIYKGEEMTVLIGHPSPPAGFRRVAAEGLSAAVLVSDSTAGFAHANTVQPFAGALTSFFSYQDFMSASAPEALALAIHELFHAQETRIAPGKFGDIQVVLWGQYPEFSARNRALLALEAQTLRAAIDAEDEAQARRQAAEFLALRAERRKELEPSLARYESGEEASEGLAQYIELRALELLPGAGGPAGAEAAAGVARRLDALKNLSALPRDRDRFYALGMAQGAVLDRLRPGWKLEYQSSPLLLDELLARAAEPLTSAQTAALLDKLAYPQVLAEQEKLVEQRTEEGIQRLTRLLSGSGLRVVFEPGPLKNHVELRGFNPNGSVMLSPARVAHTFLLLQLGAAPGPVMRLEFRAMPVVYDRDQDALWCMLPEDVVKKAVADYAAAPPERAGRLALKSGGFSGEMSGVQLDLRGRELRVRPLRDLQQIPKPKPPEFIRPDQP